MIPAVEPLFSIWFVVLTLLVLCGVILYRMSSWKQCALSLCILVLAAIFGFGFSLQQTTEFYPQQPVNIVFEDSAILAEKSVKEARRIKQLLKDLPGAVGIKKTGLSRELMQTPFFRDYSLLPAQLSLSDPLQIIVGEGFHTAPDNFLYTGRQLEQRAFFKTGTPRRAEAAVKAVDPVQRRRQPGRVEWEIDLSGNREFDNSRLILKRENEIIKTIDSPVDGRLSLSSPRLTEGQHYFELLFLTEDEETLAVSHPRRVSLAAVVSDVRRRVIISDIYPSWRSGWWSRRVSGLEDWEIDYWHRRLKDSPPAGADLVVFVGFPENSREFDYLQQVIDSEIPLLFIASQPQSESLAVRTLSALGFAGTSSFLYHSGEFTLDMEPRGELYPVFARFEELFSRTPPLSETLVNLQAGEFEPLLKTRGEIFLAVNKQRPFAFIGSPEFHLLTLQWGRFGREEAGGRFARELLRLLVRRGERGEDRLFAQRILQAGEYFSLAGRSLQSFKFRGPYAQSWDDEIPPRLRFYRPGLYQLTAITREGSQINEEVIVLEPEAERLGGGEDVSELLSGDNVFSDTETLKNWAYSTWEEQSSVRTSLIWPWNNIFHLLLIVAVLSVTWILRDFYE